MVVHTSLARRTSRDTEGDVARVLGKLEASGRDLTILRVMANSAGTFRAFVLLADALMNRSVLPPVVRESVILWIAARAGNAYETAEHVPIARENGLSDEDVAALCEGRVPSHGDARLAITVVEEHLARGQLSQATWDQAAAAWGVDGALDLLLTVGWWGGIVQTITTAIGLQQPDERGVG